MHAGEKGKFNFYNSYLLVSVPGKTSIFEVTTLFINSVAGWEITCKVAVTVSAGRGESVNASANIRSIKYTRVKFIKFLKFIYPFTGKDRCRVKFIRYDNIGHFMVLVFRTSCDNWCNYQGEG